MKIKRSIIQLIIKAFPYPFLPVLIPFFNCLIPVGSIYENFMVEKYSEYLKSNYDKVVARLLNLR